MRRPLFYTTLFFALGILIEYYLKIIISWILPFFAMSIFLYLKTKEHKRHGFAAVCAILFFFGMALTSIHDLSYEKEYSHLEETSVSFTGRAISFQSKKMEEDNMKYTFLLLKEEGKRVLVSGYDSPDNCKNMQKQLNGAYVKVTGKPEKPRPEGNPGLFDYQLYLKSKKAALLLKASSIEVVKLDSAGKFLNYLCNMRDDFFEYMERKIGIENTSMARAMLFGDKTSMDQETYREFQLNGTAHILATSGLHLGIIYGAVSGLLNMGRRKIFNLFLIFFFGSYIAMANFSSSIIRAALMILVSSAGKVFHRKYDLLSSISLSAFLLLLWNPYNLFSAGFQMSFLAVGIIAVTFSKIERLKAMETYSKIQKEQLGDKEKIGYKIKEGLLTTGVIQLCMTPYTIFTFNYISFSSFLANLPVTFLGSYLLLIYLGSMVFFTLFGTIPGPGLWVNDIFTKLFVKTNGLTYAGGLLTFDVKSPSILTLLVFYLLFFTVTSEETIVSYIRRDYGKILKKLLPGLCLCIFVYLGSLSPVKDGQVLFLDVGQGDSLHIRSGKYNILIDGGGSINYNVGEKTLKPYLLKNGVSKLDLAAATHLHTDHYKGLKELEEVYPVKNMLTKARAGQTIKLGSDTIEVLWPLSENQNTEDENLNSLIFKITVDGISYLVTGDITKEGEEMLLKKYKGTGKLKCHVLKIAHHGSSYSSCSEFLDEVDPEIAVISVGKNNYGHPGPDVLKRLEERNINVFRTDLNGAVGVWNHRGKIRCSGHMKW